MELALVASSTQGDLASINQNHTRYWHCIALNIDFERTIYSARTRAIALHAYYIALLTANTATRIPF
jgi:hypothetical protein